MSLVPRVKITVPAFPPGFVPRPQLCAGLDAAAAADVGLVCAPAGYGKTLLLADWARWFWVMASGTGRDQDGGRPVAHRVFLSAVTSFAHAGSAPVWSVLVWSRRGATPRSGRKPQGRVGLLHGQRA
jgi:hypothetical protein